MKSLGLSYGRCHHKQASITSLVVSGIIVVNLKVNNKNERGTARKALENDRHRDLAASLETLVTAFLKRHFHSALVLTKFTQHKPLNS